MPLLFYRAEQVLTSVKSRAHLSFHWLSDILLQSVPFTEWLPWQIVSSLSLETCNLRPTRFPTLGGRLNWVHQNSSWDFEFSCPTQSFNGSNFRLISLFQVILRCHYLKEMYLRRLAQEITKARGFLQAQSIRYALQAAFLLFVAFLSLTQTWPTLGRITPLPQELLRARSRNLSIFPSSPVH